MKTVVATIIETNEYKVKIDVEDDATEDEIRDIIEEAYLEDDCNMGIVSSTYDIKIKDGEQKWKKNNALVMIVTLPVITGTVNTAVHFVVGSMETLNLTVRIVTRWIIERTVNK